MRGPPTLEVLGLPGSLRLHSLNRYLLTAAAARAPQGMSISVYDHLGAVPIFNEDLETAPGPEPVVRLRTAVARADALLIATPEYNQSLPGMVKNSSTGSREASLMSWPASRSRFSAQRRVAGARASRRRQHATRSQRAVRW
jgi:hypothetical protein